jgi:hypothetical protein
MAGFIGNQPPKVPMTSADIVDGTVTADDLNSTLNLSSKTVTLPASSVTSHVTSFDDSDIRSDILHLAIAQSLNDNRIAFSLEDSFVDTFEDSSGIDAGGNLTNVARDTTGEYVSSIYTVLTTTQSASGLWSGNTGNVTFSGNDITTTTGDKQIYLTGVISGDFELDAIIGLNSPSGGAFGVFRSNETITGTNDFNNMTNIWYYDRPNMGGASTTAISYGQSAPGGGSVTTSNGDAYKLERVSGVFKMYLAGTLRHTYTQQDTGDVKIIFGWSGVTGNYINDVSWTSSVSSTNATGTLISDPQTASTSRTSASGVIIYEDADGTNTLGTDLKIYFSCDNSTWTEASSYGTATTYSGTKKLVKLGATTCTAGTSIAMKAVWADQNTAKTITPSGNAQHSTTQNKIGASSMHFDGTGDYITTSANITQSLTGDFTIEGWCYFSAINTTIVGSLSNWDYNSASTGDWILLVDGAGIITFNVKGVGGAGTSAAHGTLNTWKHISVVRESNTTKIYVDGTLANTPSTSVTGTLSVNNIVTLGRAATNLTGAYNGYIDEFRISNTARYTANFTPSTTAFTSDANTRLLLSSNTSNGSTTFTDSSNAEKEARLHGWAVNY